MLHALPCFTKPRVIFYMPTTSQQKHETGLFQNITHHILEDNPFACIDPLFQGRCGGGCEDCCFTLWRWAVLSVWSAVGATGRDCGGLDSQQQKDKIKHTGINCSKYPTCHSEHTRCDTWGIHMCFPGVFLSGEHLKYYHHIYFSYILKSKPTISKFHDICFSPSIHLNINSSRPPPITMTQASFDIPEYSTFRNILSVTQDCSAQGDHSICSLKLPTSARSIQWCRQI